MFEKYTASQETEKIHSLSQREREEATVWLGEGLSAIAGAINRETGFVFADDECRVSMDAFGSLYDKRIRKDDRKIVMANSLNASGIIDTPLYQEAHAAGNANPSENAEIRKLLGERTHDAKKSDGQLAEAVATIVLHKAISDRFLVTRASEYDDYENGVDTLIVDKETGETVCAFDEVVDTIRSGDAGANRYQKKIARSKESIRKHGGMRVKYGVTYSEGVSAPKMELCALDHVPTFCLSLERSELYGLIREMKRDIQEMSGTERSFLINLIGKLELQEQDFRESGFIAEADRLGRFRQTLHEKTIART